MFGPCSKSLFEPLPLSTVLLQGPRLLPELRRAADDRRAAHLVDEVLPAVPVRQWVLTLPYRLRYLLAWDHGLTRAVLAVYTRALLGFYRRQANRNGIRDGRTGTLTVIQRFGSGLNLNVHFHTPVFDGVFRRPLFFEIYFGRTYRE